jgi:hypothetical protein
MKLHWLAILSVIVFSGCTSRDPIDRVVQQASSNRYFGNGPFKPINLPPTSPITNLLAQAFEKTFPLPSHVEKISILEQREVSISSISYTAVLVETENGRKVVLLRYINDQRWWSEVYNP